MYHFYNILSLLKIIYCILSCLEIINWKDLLNRGEAFYPSVNTLGVGEHKDSKEAIDKLVDDVEKQ